MMRERRTIEEQVERLKENLGCPCTYLPPREDEMSIMSAYQEAAERGKREGFTPLLLVLAQWGNLAEMFGDLEAFRQEDLDEEALFNISSMVGCYVFETARLCYGGEYFWIQEEGQPGLAAGHPDFLVVIKAWEKVKGRLIKGEEDNIPFYIAGYKEHIEIGRTKPGYHVTIV